MIGSIGLFCLIGLFFVNALATESNPESLIGLVFLAAMILQGILFLGSLVGVSLGVAALLKEKNKSLAVIGVGLNLILLCPTLFMFGIGYTFIV